MIFNQKETTLRNGQKIQLRSARKEDAPALVEYLKTTAVETQFLTREPDEITITPEREETFIQGIEDSPKELMLLAFMDGQHIGNCSLHTIGNQLRYRHRCGLAIALYQKYCGLGIGKIMLQTGLDAAKECGYEQAELEVVSTNERAIRLYESLGFEKYGTLTHSMKYQDDSYADDCLMMRKL